MKIVDQIRKRIKGLLTAPLEEVGHWTRFLRFQIELWRFCAQRLQRNNAMAMSSALSFRTIFAIVPALVLAMFMLELGPKQDPKELTQTMMSFIGMSNIRVNEGAPTSEEDKEALDKTTDTIKENGENQVTPEPDGEEAGMVSAAEKIEGLIIEVKEKLTFGKIGPVGVVLLIWTVLTLLTTIERSLNRIFEAKHARPLGKRVLLYWSLVTLCPLLAVTATYLGRSGVATLQTMPVISFLIEALGWAGSFIVLVFLVAAIYSLMPNTKVTFRSALGGAAVAVPLWLIVKFLFALYVNGLVKQKNIYGALGLIPLFLLWMNLSWWFFLFGAEIAHTAANLDQMQAEELAISFDQTPTITLAAAVAVGRSFVAGSGPVDTAHIATQVKLSPAITETIVEKLMTLKIISRVDQESPHLYQLARPAEMIKMTELLQMDDDPTRGGGYTFGDEVNDSVQHFKMHARDALGNMTLAEVMKEHGQDSI